ncbi:cystatin-9-like [Oryctolagus cuniculus]|uniref:cystatin-9-like n=1 Tax=Oryctolagus cuniculus TaxID=9986 RepID=UPI002230EC8C|nr:cystatin-9-like [Oryctolagus cuniculus]
MSWRPGSWALPWALLPLLFGFCLLETYSVITEEQNDLADRKVMNSYLPATVEFALYTFNQQSKDEQAYRLERILASWRDKKQYNDIVFSMELLLRRTTCGKLEEDTENCPFEDRPERSRSFTCFFTVRTLPWMTKFDLFNKTCSEVSPDAD